MGYCSRAPNIIARFQAPGVTVVASVAVVRAGAAPMIVVTPLARPSSITRGR